MNRQSTNARDGNSAGPTETAGSRVTVRWRAGGLLVCLAAAGILMPARSVVAEDMKATVEERVKQATVLVFTAISEKEKGDKPMGSGSGFFINNTGLLISNNHVVDPMHRKSQREKFNFHYRAGRVTWTVVMDAGTDDEKTYEAMVLYQNEAADQAILQAYDEEEEKLLTPNYLRLLPESQLKKRLKVYALGFPGGDSQRAVKDKHPPVSITEGHVLEVPRTPGGRIRMVYTDVIARPGNSGGPMVNVDGYLVGTVTLMTPPEGREDTGGANYSALVPAKLSADMIRYAFNLGKILEGTDVTPFMEMLTQEDGQLNIPEFRRLDDREVLFYEDGDRIYGSLESGKLAWDSPLGQLEVPTAAVAYVMTNEEASHLFLEGGNRIASENVDASFEFTPKNGGKKTLSIDDVQTIAFRTAGRQLEPVGGKVVVLDSELTHLRLSDVQGTVKFETKMGSVDVKLEDVVRIGTSEDDDQVITLTDGRRMTGQFNEDKYKAIIAATKTPIEFGLNEVTNARIEIVQHRPNAAGGLELPGILADADRDVTRIVDTLEDGDAASARAKVEAILESTEFRGMPDAKKEQFRLLAAVAAMRDGDAKAAPKLFRKCLRAESDNIATYAKACNALLKRHEDFQFEGQPLSDKATFVAAGTALANEYIQRVRDRLKDAKSLEGDSKTDYVKSIGIAKKNEDPMKAAAVFMGTEADDELIRLWKLAAFACQRELFRIDEEIKDRGSKGKGSSQKRSRGSGKGTRLAMQREVDELNEHREKVQETLISYVYKLYDYGFRIEDPDIQQQRERQDEEEPEDQPEDEPEAEPDDEDEP